MNYVKILFGTYCGQRRGSGREGRVKKKKKNLRLIIVTIGLQAQELEGCKNGPCSRVAVPLFGPLPTTGPFQTTHFVTDILRNYLYRETYPEPWDLKQNLSSSTDSCPTRGWGYGSLSRVRLCRPTPYPKHCVGKQTQRLS